MSGSAACASTHAPAFGEHTREILKSQCVKMQINKSDRNDAAGKLAFH
jgi:hypothetical protein